MALKPPPFPPPPPIGEVIEQINTLVGPSGIASEVDRNARQLLQSALRRLDFVSREEFDAQCAVLERTRARVMTLEGEVAALSDQLQALEAAAADAGSG